MIQNYQGGNLGSLLKSIPRAVIFVVCQVIALVIFYSGWLLGRKTFYFKDASLWYEPLCSFIGRSLASGHLPLWNPFTYCGMSEIAISVPGLFYLPNLLFAAFPFSVALALMMVFSQALCGLGGFLLVEALGWGAWPAAICGLVLAFSGYMFTLSSNHTLVAAVAWFPWCLLAVHKLFTVKDERTVRWLLALAASLFMLIAAGQPEISAPSLVLIASYAVYCWSVSSDLQERKQRMVATVKSFVLGVLLAMPIILPLAEWLRLSRRSEGLNVNETLMFSANWFDLVSLLSFQPLGNLQLAGSPFRPLVCPNNLEPYFGSAFVGPAVLLLVVIGMSKRGGLLFWLSAAALAGSLLLSLGSNVSFVQSLVETVPAFSILRFPSKLLFFAVFCAAMFAARGLRIYITDGRGCLKAAALIVLALAVTGVALVSVHQILLPFIPLVGASAELSQSAQVNIGGGLIVASVIAGACLLLLFAAGRQRMKQAACAMVAIVACVLLTNAFMFTNPGGPPDFYKRPSAMANKLKEIDGTKGNRCIALFFEKFSAPRSPSSESQWAKTVAAMQYSRQVLRPFANIDYCLPSSFGFEGAMNGEYYYLLENCYLKSSQSLSGPSAEQGVVPGRTDAPLSRFLGMTNTRYVITQDVRYQNGQPVAVPPLDSQLFEMVWRDVSLNVRLYVAKNVAPRAYLSYQWNVLPSRDEVLDQIYHADTSNWDASRLTLIEPPYDDLTNSASKAPLQPVVLQEGSPEHLLATVNTNEPAVFVLADQFYPGWTVKVDSAEATLLHCNGFLRGVYVPAGSHRIEFSYEPKSLLYGFALAALALLWAAALFFQRKKARD